MSGPAMQALLAGRIAQGGPMPVETFMRTCLLEDGLGYYRRKQAIGASGDFITAPEISQVFGELAGIWVAAAWTGLGEPARWRLIELGPGRGTLMADLLRALRVLPAARAGLEVVLVEANALLREQQGQALAASGAPTSWLDDTRSLAGLRPLPTVIVANEFLDALPIAQQVASAGRWHERRVGLLVEDDTEQISTPRPARARHLPLKGEGSQEANTSPLGRGMRGSVGEGLRFVVGSEIAASDASDGAIREVMVGARELIGGLAADLNSPVYVLVIDYGYLGPALGDTLQAVQGHRYVDPLATAGEADLSAQVDFAQVIAAARDGGLDAYGPITQSEFLGRLGAAERLERLTRDKDAATVQTMQSGLGRLMQPAGMGGRFKALALASKGLARPPVF